VGWLYDETELDPSDAMFHYRLGQSLAASGKFAVASVAFEEALALS
jgi:Flp pilus assembly protein TadD